MLDSEVGSLIVELIKQFSSPVFESAKTAGKDFSEKLKVTFDVCFSKYLKRSYDRYSKIKTLLYRDAPVRLKDFYVRTDLSINYDETLKESDFINALKENRRVVISGTAGSGKSTFCKSIFIELIENPIGIFPIFIELRHLNGRGGIGLIDYIIEVMQKIDSKFTREQFDYAVRLGKIMLILDGFDEISREDVSRFELELMEFSGSYQNLIVLVSSRPDSRFDAWDEFYNYSVLPLDKSKALSLIEKLSYDDQLKKSFLKELNDNLYEKHESFASNPLLLTMMLMTYEQIAEIPNKIHLFYEQAFLTLFNKHDSMKSLYKRKSFSGLPLDEFKKVLSLFCALSYSKEKYHFNEEEIRNFLSDSISVCGFNVGAQDVLNDLVYSVCIIQKDGVGYTFTHRSFQEYFAALFLLNFSGNKKFDLIDKFAFVSDMGSVIPMVFDMNPAFLEKYWVIPKIENLLREYEAVVDFDVLNVFSIFYDAIAADQFFDEDYDEGGNHDEGDDDQFSSGFYSDKSRLVMYIKRDDHNYCFFKFLMDSLYGEERRKYVESRLVVDEEKRIIERRIIDLHVGVGNSVNLNEMSDSLKDDLRKSEFLDRIIFDMNYFYVKLDELREINSKKESEVFDLILS